MAAGVIREACPTQASSHGERAAANQTLRISLPLLSRLRRARLRGRVSPLQGRGFATGQFTPQQEPRTRAWRRKGDVRRACSILILFMTETHAEWGGWEDGTTAHQKRRPLQRPRLPVPMGVNVLLGKSTSYLIQQQIEFDSLTGTARSEQWCFKTTPFPTPALRTLSSQRGRRSLGHLPRRERSGSDPSPVSYRTLRALGSSSPLGSGSP